MPRPIIIILEDDKNFLDQHTDRLRGAGYDCWPTQDCNQAVRWACENPDIRMVLVDEMLLEFGDVPDETRQPQRLLGSGVIREINFHREDVKFIYITASPVIGSQGIFQRLRNNACLLRNQRGVIWLFHRYEFEDSPEKAYQELIRILEEPQAPSIQLIVDLRAISKKSCGICQIKLVKFANGLEKGYLTGTGWMVTPQLVLTCWHTISPSPSIFENAISEADLAQQISSITVDFDYLTKNYVPQEHPTNLIHYNKDLDYALLQVKECKNNFRSFISIDLTDLADPEISQPSTILLQHPQGLEMGYAFGWYVQKFEDNPSKILHKIESRAGSSGGPLLNQSNYKAFAMHVGLEKYFYDSLPAAVLLKYIIDDIKLKKPSFYSDIARHQESLV
jgi:hypothetical protein